MWAPVAFLLAGLVAVPSALAFSELSARVPEAAGDSSYVEVGLNLHWLALLVGAINIIAGTVAAAAVLAEYAQAVGIVHDEPCAVLRGHPRQGGERRDVAVHAENAVGDDQSPAIALAGRQPFGRSVRIGMPVAARSRPGKTDAVDQ